ncbi:FtsX-like permease family protein [Enterococcus ratti]|uniref:ABC-type antimicrobial peptide transport system, permease component n=1 Tax=Enterococcus ratti TaxID=150033 RepID=A0A1L8WL18_9ENTE|nr:FtsX-like permease family protein [Enterococcus ratti]OJG81723.1 ABC-type antimicrobial peptide transport system, permease component [Enterococcus ratti]
MLWKLSLTGIKSRLRDYIVLFSGLVMTSAIFYMFESIASNTEFLKSNSTISLTVLIFQFGSVLLGIITFVYIIYANSFLMTMRQKDYAMFMMLGAKSKKIAQMIFFETFIVGTIATVTGSIIGIGLTNIVHRLLVNQLNIKLTHFASFNLQGLITTLLFFAVLFLFAAFANAYAIVKKPILTLLRANQTPAHIKQTNFLLKVVLGIACLSIGYYVLANIMVYQMMGIGIALVTIILGTYFIFHSVLIFLLTLLKKTENISMKKLNNFTLSQLSFRIREYTQMLSMVAMLFALALGALTVGLGFKNQILASTEGTTPYDIVLNNAQKVNQQQILKLKPTFNVTYAQKEDEQSIYYNASEFNKNPLEFMSNNGNMFEGTKVRKVTGEELATQEELQFQLSLYELPSQQGKTIQVVTADEFKQLNLPQASLQVLKVKDFMADLEAIGKLVKENVKNNPEFQTIEMNTSQKYVTYQMMNGIFSGFEFMGFFLGIAFLAMLASCLMFKILSGSKSDIGRYIMLEKIGAKRQLLRQSIRREIGVLFLAPGILGAVHVWFGLKMFTPLLADPYHNVWVSFMIFFVMYFVYYVLTVLLYTGIVLNRKK